MTITTAALVAEITNDPEGLGYAEFVGNANGVIAEKLNLRNRTMYKSRWITDIGILDLYTDGPILGDVVLSKLEALAQSAHPAAGCLRRSLARLARDPGMDIGSANTHAIIDSLVDHGITADEATKLKALALSPCSRAEQLFGVGTTITETDVIGALNANV